MIYSIKKLGFIVNGVWKKTNILVTDMAIAKYIVVTYKNSDLASDDGGRQLDTV